MYTKLNQISPLLAYFMTDTSNLAMLFLKNCVGCGACVEICPSKAIPDSLIGFISSLARIDKQKCDGCGDCIQVCPHKAIKLFNKFTLMERI